MEAVVRAAAIAIPAAILASAIKRDSPSIALALILAASAAALYLAISPMRLALETAEELAGISIVSRIASDMLRDAGMAGGASAVELAGASAGVFVSLPLLRTIMDMVKELL